VNLNYYKDQFDMVSQCKVLEIRDRQLAVIMTNMEVEYSIPGLRDDTYNRANPHIIELYQKVSNARTI